MLLDETRHTLIITRCVLHSLDVGRNNKRLLITAMPRSDDDDAPIPVVRKRPVTPAVPTTPGFLSRFRILHMLRLAAFPTCRNTVRMLPTHSVLSFRDRLQLLNATTTSSIVRHLRDSMRRAHSKIKMLGNNLGVFVDYVAVCVDTFMGVLHLISVQDIDDTCNGAKESASAALLSFQTCMRTSVCPLISDVCARAYNAFEDMENLIVQKSSSRKAVALYQSTKETINRMVSQIIIAVRAGGNAANSLHSVTFALDELCDLAICRQYTGDCTLINGRSGRTFVVTGSSVATVYTYHHSEMLALLTGVGVVVNNHADPSPVPYTPVWSRSPHVTAVVHSVVRSFLNCLRRVLSRPDATTDLAQEALLRAGFFRSADQSGWIQCTAENGVVLLPGIVLDASAGPGQRPRPRCSPPAGSMDADAAAIVAYTSAQIGLMHAMPSDDTGGLSGQSMGPRYAQAIKNAIQCARIVAHCQLVERRASNDLHTCTAKIAGFIRSLFTDRIRAVDAIFSEAASIPTLSCNDCNDRMRSAGSTRCTHLDRTETILQCVSHWCQSYGFVYSDANPAYITVDTTVSAACSEYTRYGGVGAGAAEMLCAVVRADQTLGDDDGIYIRQILLALKVNYSTCNALLLLAKIAAYRINKLQRSASRGVFDVEQMIMFAQTVHSGRASRDADAPCTAGIVGSHHAETGSGLYDTMLTYNGVRARLSQIRAKYLLQGSEMDAIVHTLSAEGVYPTICNPAIDGVGQTTIDHGVGSEPYAHVPRSRHCYWCIKNLCRDRCTTVCNDQETCSAMREYLARSNGGPLVDIDFFKQSKLKRPRHRRSVHKTDLSSSKRSFRPVYQEPVHSPKRIKLQPAQECVGIRVDDGTCNDMGKPDASQAHVLPTKPFRVVPLPLCLLQVDPTGFAMESATPIVPRPVSDQGFKLLPSDGCG